MEATAEKTKEQQGIMAPPKEAKPPAEQAEEQAQAPEPEPPQAPPQAPSQAPPKAIFVSGEDRLRAENLNQRKLIAAQQITILQMQLQDAVRRSQDIEQEIGAMRQELEQKYSTDFNLNDIRPSDGRIVPKNPASAAFTQRMMGR